MLQKKCWLNFRVDKYRTANQYLKTTKWEIWMIIIHKPISIYVQIFAVLLPVRNNHNVEIECFIGELLISNSNIVLTQITTNEFEPAK